MPSSSATKATSTQIRRHGDITGRLLRLLGFNLDLCPVLDISFDDEADNSLRGRCYGRTAAEVIEKAGAFNEGLRATGMLSCGKHFPGYACAALDPHHELPVIERSREAMEEHELAVFRNFTDKVDSMMIAHISISGLEPGNCPASLSPTLIQGLLRDDLGFEGLIMTDDLDMGAILNHYGFEETMKRGVAAGNDLLMICHRIELAPQARELTLAVCQPPKSSPPWPASPDSNHASCHRISSPKQRSFRLIRKSGICAFRLSARPTRLSEAQKTANAPLSNFTDSKWRRPNGRAFDIDWRHERDFVAYATKTGRTLLEQSSVSREDRRQLRRPLSKSASLAIAASRAAAAGICRTG